LISLCTGVDQFEQLKIDKNDHKKREREREKERMRILMVSSSKAAI